MKKQWKVKYVTLNLYGVTVTHTTSAAGETFVDAYLDAVRTLSEIYRAGNANQVVTWAITEMIWLPKYGEDEKALFDSKRPAEVE